MQDQITIGIMPTGLASNEALMEFTGECAEILARVSDVLASLEKNEPISKYIDALYRDIHTLKGSSQLFGFVEIGQLAHAIEASLGPVRKYKITLSPEFIDAIYRCLDLIEAMVHSISDGQKEFSPFQDDFQLKIGNLIEAAAHQFGGEYFTLNETFLQNEIKLPDLQEPKVDSASVQPLAPSIAKLESQANVKPEIKLEVKPEVKSEAKLEAKSEAKKDLPLSPVDTTIRIQVELLDRLMNLAGELVLVRNQVLQHASRSEDLEFLNLSQGLDLVTSELQGEVMKTRMQPIGNVVSKFQRVVRDLAKDLRKQIDLTLQGSETELDKTLLEAIKDPLTHLVRNSCDHGIETIDERIAHGKPETGHILIRSYHEGGQVLIEISDDGKGLDSDRILAKAIEKGLLSQEKASKLPEREIYNLIFLPGFSTAQQVTSVSGRGVGMDVVKTNIEKIGGTVELESLLGKGTTIKLKIPLTLAIVPALIVRHCKERFAIPQVKLVELVRVDGKDSGNCIEYLQKKPMYRLRGSLLPLVSLGEVLALETSETSALKDDGTNIVVLNAEGEKFGLIVDEILDTTEIVVKPLSQFLKFIGVFSGATIMGDGSVSLILDVAGVAEKIHLTSGQQKKGNTFADSYTTKQGLGADFQEFLLFRIQNHGIHAIPLCLVHRLEEFSVERIEASGEQRVVQYRNSILPLITLSKTLKYTKIEESKKTVESVIVIQRLGRLFGIVVDEILDIIVFNGAVDDSIRDRDGLLGNLLHEDEVVVVADAFRVIEMEAAHLGNRELPPIHYGTALPQGSRKETSQKVRILFAEDVAFFRKQVSSILTAAGYEVVVAENGAEALKKLDASESGEFTLVLSDIEMPEMNGLELARAVRKLNRFVELPMIALTTRFRDSDVREGKRAGFNLYLEKLNEERLLIGIEDVLRSVAKS